MPPANVKSLSHRVFHKWLIPALCEWAVIVCLFAIGFIFHNLFVWAIVIILLGSRQHALGVLGHDSAHFAASSSRKINDLSAELLCFWPLLTGLGDFRRFHLNHHRYLDTEKDPELLFKDSWSKPQWTLPMSRSGFSVFFFLTCLGLGFLKYSKLIGCWGKQVFEVGSVRSCGGQLSVRCSMSLASGSL